MDADLDETEQVRFRSSHKIYLIKCSITNVLGSDLTGDDHVFDATRDDIHVTLDEDEDLVNFDDNVNSAFCGCFIHPV